MPITTYCTKEKWICTDMIRRYANEYVFLFCLKKHENRKNMNDRNDNFPFSAFIKPKEYLKSFPLSHRHEAFK